MARVSTRTYCIHQAANHKVVSSFGGPGNPVFAGDLVVPMAIKEVTAIAKMWSVRSRWDGEAKGKMRENDHVGAREGVVNGGAGDHVEPRHRGV